MPDEHLGTNTALAMGVSREQIGVWDPTDPPDPQTLADCRIVVWKGYCYVHTTFTPEDVDAVRSRYPGVRIVVHPECPHEVVAKADASGSTTAIIKFVERRRPGPPWPSALNGTWSTACRASTRIASSCRCGALGCRSMGMTSPADLLYVLDRILAGRADERSAGGRGDGALGAPGVGAHVAGRLGRGLRRGYIFDSRAAIPGASREHSDGRPLGGASQRPVGVVRHGLGSAEMNEQPQVFTSEC
jgi:hypothetical protein